MRLIRTKTPKLLAVVLLLFLGLTSSFVTRSLAQDTPTERPFPVAATHTPAPSSPSSSQPQGQPTERPFPGVRATVKSAAATVETTAEATVEATAEATTALTTGDALATAEQLRAENKTLQDQLASAQTDKGATLYAIVIVVIGALLAFGVFFGLRRSGK